MATIGEFNVMPPVEPENGAPPKAKTPPSEPTIQCGAFGGCVKVTVAVCGIAKPSVSSVAENLALPAAWLDAEKVATPDPSVTAELGDRITPAAVLWSETLLPATGLAFASCSATVRVVAEVPSAGIEVGDAV